MSETRAADVRQRLHSLDREALLEIAWQCIDQAFSTRALVSYVADSEYNDPKLTDDELRAKLVEDFLAEFADGETRLARLINSQENDRPELDRSCFSRLVNGAVVVLVRIRQGEPLHSAAEAAYDAGGVLLEEDDEGNIVCAYQHDRGAVGYVKKPCKSSDCSGGTWCLRRFFSAGRTWRMLRTAKSGSWRMSDRAIWARRMLRRLEIQEPATSRTLVGREARDFAAHMRTLRTSGTP